MPDTPVVGEPGARTTAVALPTTYRGHRFRSRLEARWAVFFDHLGIGWQYEPQGYLIDGRPYLPDFLLECGTWVEVKGAEEQLDKLFLLRAALQLPYKQHTNPSYRYEHGPQLMILGPLPHPDSHEQDGLPPDYGWVGLDADGRGDELHYERYGFGLFRKKRRPWGEFAGTEWDPRWLTPSLMEYEPGCPDAYRAANGARFEHGERGR